jgi:Recombination endonuclease VII
MIKTQMIGMRGQKLSDKVIESRWRAKGIDFTVEDYNGRLETQNYRCGICHKHQDEFKLGLFVDHDHSTGIVRGLLCVRCNSLLGLSLDSICILENAIKYLSPHVFIDIKENSSEDEDLICD